MKTPIVWIDRKILESDDGHSAAWTVYNTQPGNGDFVPLVVQSDAERQLRRMLCVAYAGPRAYMDDGEASDCRQFPLIDFMRDTPDEIQRKLQERGRYAVEQLPLKLYQTCAEHIGQSYTFTATPIAAYHTVCPICEASQEGQKL